MKFDQMLADIDGKLVRLSSNNADELVLIRYKISKQLGIWNPGKYLTQSNLFSCLEHFPRLHVGGGGFNYPEKFTKRRLQDVCKTNVTKLF